MLPPTLNALLSLATADGVPAEIRDNALFLRASPLPSPLIVRLRPEHGVIDLLQALPLTAPPDRVGAVAMALALLNHALVLPGLGMHPGSGTIYVRLAAPLLPGRDLDPEVIRASARAATALAAELTPALARVCQGAPPESVVGDASVDLALGTRGG